jgi:phenylacetate-CoA ligase
MRRMARIGGRSDDMLIVRGVNVFPTQIEEILLAEPRLSAHYVLELRRDGRLDDLKVVSEVKPNGIQNDLDGARLTASIVARVKDLVGVTVSVQLVAPGTIERSLGKAKRIVDLRKVVKPER